MQDPYLLIKKVTAANTTSLPDEPLVVAATASNLNYPPGNFPYVLQTDLGNGKPFEFARVEEIPGFVAAIYLQPGSPLQLHVVNDNSGGVRKAKPNRRN